MGSRSVIYGLFHGLHGVHEFVIRKYELICV